VAITDLVARATKVRRVVPRHGWHAARVGSARDRKGYANACSRTSSGRFAGWEGHMLPSRRRIVIADAAAGTPDTSTSDVRRAPVFFE
jgi:hypothetical protein